jgi:hypothetical protein
MTSKTLERLTKSNKNYDLSVDFIGSGKQNEIAIKATLTLFTPGVDGKPGVTDRRVIGIATGTDFKVVKAEAIGDALKLAGI